MDKPSAFVIMSPAAQHQGVYRLIKRVFEQDLGWRCVQLGELAGAGSSVRETIEGIAGANLVVVNLVALDGDALYALGVAHVLGNNVLTLFSGPEDQLPLNLKNYRRIHYENSFDGAERLAGDLRSAVQSLPQWGSRPNNPVQDFLPAERRSGAPASPAPLPATPRDEEQLREIAYARELANAVRRRLHYLQIQLAEEGRRTDPSIRNEAEDLTRQLDELRTSIARLETHS